MSQGLTRYVPLKTVISYFLDQYKKSDADEDMLWIIGMRGLTELNYDISAEPKTVRLPVQPNMTVRYPRDLLSWTKIGIMDEKGQVSSLKINNASINYMERYESANRIGALTPDINDGASSISQFPAFLNFYTHGYYNNYFGVTGGLVQYGECRVDDANRVIILNTDFKYSSILLEYISSPVQDPDFTVDLALQEAVIAFIAWKLKLGTAQEFYGEMIKSRRRLPGKKNYATGIKSVYTAETELGDTLHVHNQWTNNIS